MSYVAASTNNPYGAKPWKFATSTSGLGNAGCPKGLSSCAGCSGCKKTLSYYAAAQFSLPTSGRRGLGAFQTDMSTLPPAPSGEQYVTAAGSAIPQLQAIPQQPLSPIDTLGGVAILLAGGWWMWQSWRNSLASASRLPVVQMNPRQKSTFWMTAKQAEAEIKRREEHAEKLRKLFGKKNPESRFAALEHKLIGSARARHYPLRSPGGLAATIGRRKYGAARFERMALRGRR